MTSVESLLSCAALEKMKKKSTYQHSPDQELIGQGLSTMTSALLMGMPVTSLIARSSINVRLNARRTRAKWLCCLPCRLYVVHDCDHSHARLEWCSHYDRTRDAQSIRIQTLFCGPKK
mmetsp:Transcript_46795/g.47586  ORF Transcript_46795/g.47586 Transcript_46795/m.47586 type:complete len:118 (-) Transcript_46795:1238-1591(-)